MGFKSYQDFGIQLDLFCVFLLIFKQIPRDKRHCFQSGAFVPLLSPHCPKGMAGPTSSVRLLLQLQSWVRNSKPETAESRASLTPSGADGGMQPPYVRWPHI